MFPVFCFQLGVFVLEDVLGAGPFTLGTFLFSLSSHRAG